jgi:hypothetical protein
MPVSMYLHVREHVPGVFVYVCLCLGVSASVCVCTWVNMCVNMYLCVCFCMIVHPGCEPLYLSVYAGVSVAGCPQASLHACLCESHCLSICPSPLASLNHNFTRPSVGPYTLLSPTEFVPFCTSLWI